MDKDELLISVIVPIYKVEQYLEECIESIINQTYGNLEIILVDDGSPDGCPYICDKYKERDERIIVIHKENGGLVSARKAGINRATGEYITFVDGDDWIKSTTYDSMVNSILKRMPDMLCTGLIEETRDAKENAIRNKLDNGYYDKDEIEKNVIPNYLSYNGTYDFGIESSLVCKLIKSSLLKQQIEYMNEDVTIGEDVICSFLSMLISESIQIDNNILGYFYRCNQESMTKKYDKNYLKKIENLFVNLDVIENKFGDGNDMKRQIGIYKMYMLMYYGMSNEACGNRFSYFQRVKYYFDKLIHDNYFYSVFKYDNEIFNKFEIKKRILINYIRDKHMYSALLLCLIPKKIVEVWNEKV